MYDKLDAKVNNINTSGFDLKIKYDTEKSDLEKNIPNTSGLVKKTDYNSNISEIESKISGNCGLVNSLADLKTDMSNQKIRLLASVLG